MLPAAARRPWPAPRPRPVGFRPGGVCFCFSVPLDFSVNSVISQALGSTRRCGRAEIPRVAPGGFQDSRVSQDRSRPCSLCQLSYFLQILQVFFSFLSLLFQFGCYSCPINLPLCVALQHTPHPSRPKERSQGMQYFDPDGCLAYGGDDDVTCRWKKGPGLWEGRGARKPQPPLGEEIMNSMKKTGVCSHKSKL
ncbi:uncharacterized protein CLUP02_01247 [Colletotrichum lupini]|uniref:Uncharacterized protein n=1 Tax=Colletotrichum lupini TaxID=145971 RepID=A0A9Q8SBY7_9PEZI|nr:uncharacterized protein CLUP02_01247 [Colletotrichum lupini]UQC74596.1 hypothetical protein CLUP02_01247 [Colletotrichum lupini]